MSGQQGEKLALRPDGHVADTGQLAAIAHEMNTGWPPLTEQQKEQLALILHAGGGRHGTP